MRKRSEIRIRRVKPEEGMPSYVRWLVEDTEARHGDACRSIFDAFRVFLWYKGVPARIAFKRFRHGIRESD